MLRHLSLLLCGLLLPLATVTSQARADILPPGGSYAGRTYNDWQVLWWQAAFAAPIVDGDHPLFSGGSLGRYDGVVLLTGIGGGAHLDLTISADTAIFVPIVNIESSVYEDPPFHGDDDESLRENSVKLLDETTGLFAEIDGVPVDDLASYRFISPSFTFGPLPPGNLLNAPVGTTSLSVDAGYYLLLTPLSVGTHTLHFGGINDAVGSSIDTTYTITVVPEPASLTMLAIAGLGSMVYRRRGRAQR